MIADIFTAVCTNQAALYPAGTTFAIGPGAQFIESNPPRVVWVPMTEQFEFTGLKNLPGVDTRNTGRVLGIRHAEVNVYLWGAALADTETLYQLFVQALVAGIGSAPNNIPYGIRGTIKYENTEANDIDGVEITVPLFLQIPMFDYVYTPVKVTSETFTYKTDFPDGDVVTNG